MESQLVGVYSPPCLEAPGSRAWTLDEARTRSQTGASTKPLKANGPTVTEVANCCFVCSLALFLSFMTKCSLSCI